jgi:hypothetical protein
VADMRIAKSDTRYQPKLAFRTYVCLTLLRLPDNYYLVGAGVLVIAAAKLPAGNGEPVAGFSRPVLSLNV